MDKWRAVQELEDGTNVEASTFNVPIGQLADRTDYLLSLIKGLRGEGKFTSVRIDARLSRNDTPSVGDIVCIDPDTKEFVKAVASMDLYDAYTASEQAFAVGMLVSRSEYEGVVCLYGIVDISEGYDVDSMTDGARFRNGQYYLSSSVPGKITMSPTGPRIMVGFFSRNQLVSGSSAGDFALLNPQHMDIEAHSHRTYRLKARPAGDAVVDPSGSRDVEDSVKIVGYMTDMEYSSGEKVEGMPRLVVGGDWTTWNDAEYDVKLTDLDGVSAPSSWDRCYIKWSAKSGDTGSGLVQVSFFGDEAAIGSYGMTVALEASDGMSPDRPVSYSGEKTEEYRTWTVDRESARGWRPADETRTGDFGSGSIVLSGVPGKAYDTVTVSVPKKVCVIAPSTQPSEGAVVTVDGVGYRFTANPEGRNDLPIEGSPYETYRGLCDVVAASAYDDENERIVIGAASLSGVGFSELDNDDETTLSIGSGTVYAIVSDKNGATCVRSIVNDGESPVPVAVIAGTYSAVSLIDGMSVMAAPKPGSTFVVSVGDAVSVDVGSGVNGAKFRYAIEFDNNLNKHFPPVPARSGSVMLNGVELESREHFGSKAVVSIGDDSVYWLDATYGRSPWPQGYENQNSKVLTDDEFRLLFHFVSEFHSETGPVTSLRPSEGSPIRVKRCGTDDDATVGDLELDLNLLLSTASVNASGYNVVKASRGDKLLLGPVVEKIIAGPGVSVTQKASQPSGQGTVTISADSTAYSGDFETIALENAKLESIGMFPYIRFLKWSSGGSNVPSGFVAKFHVPATANDAVYKVRFYASVFGEENVSGASARPCAGIKMDYNILPDYNSVSGELIEKASFNLKSDLIGPDAPIVLDVPFGVANESNLYEYRAYDPVLIHNDVGIEDVPGKSEMVLDHAIPDKAECLNYVRSHTIATPVFGVRPGYTLAIRFSRSAPSSEAEYTGPVGIINLRWALVEDDSAVPQQQDMLSNIVDATVTNMRKVASTIDTAAMTNSDAVVDAVSKVINSITK